MKRLLTALLIAAACVVQAVPVLAGTCPVKDQKISDKSYRAALQTVEAAGDSGGATVEITEPGTALTVLPGLVPAQPGPPNEEDRAVLDALTLDQDAADGVIFTMDPAAASQIEHSDMAQDDIITLP